MARDVVEGALLAMNQHSGCIAAPIRRVCEGERDAAALTVGLDAKSVLIVREILKRLSGR